MGLIFGFQDPSMLEGDLKRPSRLDVWSNRENPRPQFCSTVYRGLEIVRHDCGPLGEALTAAAHPAQTRRVYDYRTKVSA
jgi:hypothetical protein